jgi:hypothetical protein
MRALAWSSVAISTKAKPLGLPSRSKMILMSTGLPYGLRWSRSCCSVVSYGNPAMKTFVALTRRAEAAEARRAWAAARRAPAWA